MFADRCGDYVTDFVETEFGTALCMSRDYGIIPGGVVCKGGEVKLVPAYIAV